MSITISVADVRNAFPEFTSNSEYPDAMISFQITNSLLTINRFGQIDDITLKQLALYLTAHRVVFSKRSSLKDTDSVSPISSKSLGEASVSYQSSNTDSLLQANYNSTNYGQQFWDMLAEWRKAVRPFVVIGG